MSKNRRECSHGSGAAFMNGSQSSNVANDDLVVTAVPQDCGATLPHVVAVSNGVGIESSAYGDPGVATCSTADV